MVYDLGSNAQETSLCIIPRQLSNVLHCLGKLVLSLINICHDQSSDHPTHTEFSNRPKQTTASQGYGRPPFTEESISFPFLHETWKFTQAQTGILLKSSSSSRTIIQPTIDADMIKIDISGCRSLHGWAQLPRRQVVRFAPRTLIMISILILWFYACYSLTPHIECWTACSLVDPTGINFPAT